jgi:hypothetical protein
VENYAEEDEPSYGVVFCAYLKVNTPCAMGRSGISEQKLT